MADDGVFHRMMTRRRLLAAASAADYNQLSAERSDDPATDSSTASGNTV